VGTIMQILIVGLLGWSLKTNVDTITQLGILQAEVRALQVTVNQGTQDRYRGVDAAKDFQSVWAELGRINVRVDKLESKR